MATKHTPVKRKGGNPPFVATDEQRKLAMILTASGHIQRIVAARLSISLDTLQRHFRAELDEGRDWSNSSLGEVLFKEAMRGDVKAIEAWFDRRGGPEWRRRTANEQSGPGGGPIRVLVGRDLSLLNVEELEQLEKLTAKLEVRSDAPAHE